MKAIEVEMRSGPKSINRRLKLDQDMKGGYQERGVKYVLVTSQKLTIEDDNEYIYF